MRANRMLLPLLFAALPLSIGAQDRHALLSDEDLEQEIIDRHGVSALSFPDAVPPRPDSYNQWMCFDVRDTEFGHLELTQSEFGDITIPILAARLPGHEFELSITGERQARNDEISRDWAVLLDGARSVCVYAAYLQPLDDGSEVPASAWIVSEVKTENGYWSFDDRADEAEDEE